MAKVHIISSDQPKHDLERAVGASLPYGLVADCGKVVDRPRLCCMWDSTEMQAMLDFPPSVCPKCRKASDQKNARYVYAVMESK